MCIDQDGFGPTVEPVLRALQPYTVLFGTTGLTFYTHICKTCRVENSRLIGAIRLRFSAALEHRCRRSDATASSHSLKELHQPPTNQEVCGFLRSRQNTGRRAARRAAVPPKPKPTTVEVGPGVVAFACGTVRTVFRGARGRGGSNRPRVRKCRQGGDRRAGFGTQRVDR